MQKHSATERFSGEFLEPDIETAISGGVKFSWNFSQRNPVAVLGPVPRPDFSHSIRLIKFLMDGQPGCLKINAGFVDVRDVADLHLRAMTDPVTVGENMWMHELAAILRREMGDAARKVPKRELPNWIARLLDALNTA